MVTLDRRRFLGALAVSAGFRAPALPATSEFPVSFRQPGPCADLRPLVDPMNDGFEVEKRAMEVERTLSDTLLQGDFPVSAGFDGPSPMPARYEDAGGALVARYADGGEGFVAGLSRWIASVGEVRWSRFHALPGDEVRFEVASETDAGLEHRVGRWRMAWRNGSLHEFEPLEETVTRSPSPLFADVTGELFGGVESYREQLAKGLPYWRSRLDSATGIAVYGNQGIAVGDVDGDGRDEVYVCQPGGLPNRFYGRDEGGAWSDRTEEAGVGVLDDTAQALFLDLRNSGHQDLVLLTSAGPLLLVNDGAGRFRHREQAFRFRDRARGAFAGMAAADYDRDGKLDLYICSYLYFRSEDQYRYPSPYHDARNGPPNFLFRNELTADGGGHFADVTEEAGLDHNNDRYSFAAAWCDYDEDGLPELYVANDFGRNNLYKFADGKFRDIAAQAGVEDVGPGMSAAWFDSNRNGRLDLYVTNMWTAAGQRVASEPGFGPVKAGVPHSAYHGHTKGNSLYRNRPDGSFDYAGRDEGVEMGRWAWAGDGFDFDLDGTPEILVTAGMITHSPEKDLCSFFWRRVVAESPAEAKPSQGYEDGWNCLNQLVREDYSWSGSEPNVFYSRRGGKYRDFSGVSGLDRAVDSRAFAVTDFDGDGRLDLLVKSRLGPQLLAFRNQSADGREALVLELEGTRSNRDAVGAIVRVATDAGVAAQSLSGGSGYISQHTKRLHFGIGDERAASTVSVLWPSGLKQEFAGLEAGFLHRLKEGEEAVESVRLAVRNPPAPTPAPTVGENRLVFEPTWLREPVPLPEEADEGFLVLADGDDVPQLPAGLPTSVADLRSSAPDRAAAFAIFRRYLFDYRTGLQLPMTLLVDRFSRARKVYPALPSEAEMRRDLETLRGPDKPELALPFPGRYYGHPRRNHFRMGSAFLQAGYPELALPYLREAARSPGNVVKASLAIGQIALQAGDLEEAERRLGTARKLDDDSPELWNNLGGLAMAREDYPTALEHFRRTLDLNPDLPYALVNAAQVHTQLGDAAEAERLLRHALRIDPSEAEAANKLGLILAKQGRLPEARTLFQQAIEHRRDYAEAINNLAVLYLQSKQVRDAVAAFRYGIEQAPDFATFYMNLARIHTELGEYGQAREVLRALLQRDPDHAAAARALAQIQLR